MENNENKGIISRIYNWFVNLTVRGLLGAILMAFIIIIILLSVSYIPAIMSRISSSLSAALYSVFVPAENATLTADRNIMYSGEDFTVTFKKGDLTNGIFTISYACNSNINLTSVETGGLKKITCNTPYYLIENETSIKIRPVTTENVVRLVLDGSYENNDTQKIEKVGVARVTIKNDLVGVIVTPSTTTSMVVTPVNKPVIISPAYYGKADLAVRVLQLGLLNENTNIIIPRTQFTYNDMVGIRFEIRNDGDANTGPWYFTAALPSLSNPTYSSNTQISLKPGESIVFTLGFSNLTNQYSNLITVNVDPQNMVSESIEYNNILTSTITNTSYNSNYYNNNNNNYNYNYNTNYNNNGCYVNGYFTYNCFDNNYNYNYNYNGYSNYYNNLSVSCYADPNNPDTDERVRWYANAYGGDGDYTYEWTGTNGLDSSAKNPSKTYTSHGWKYATVTVESDGYSVSQTCSVYVD